MKLHKDARELVLLIIMFYAGLFIGAAIGMSEWRLLLFLPVIFVIGYMLPDLFER